MCSQGPLGSIRIASSMSPTRLLRPLGFASSTSVARVLWCPAFVATPRVCEFHICCARLMVHARVCYDPSDPYLLHAFYGAQRLLQPIRSISAARVLWCPAFARVASPTRSTQGPWNPLESRVPYICGPPGIHQNRKVPHLPRGSSSRQQGRRQRQQAATAGQRQGSSSATSTKGGE